MSPLQRHSFLLASASSIQRMVLSCGWLLLFLLLTGCAGLGKPGDRRSGGNLPPGMERDDLLTSICRLSSAPGGTKTLIAAPPMPW